jgi:hypothetical protein
MVYSSWWSTYIHDRKKECLSPSQAKVSNEINQSSSFLCCMENNLFCQPASWENIYAKVCNEFFQEL